jgi:hypothetical protein
MDGLALMLLAALPCAGESLSVDGSLLRLDVDAATGDLLGLQQVKTEVSSLAVERSPLFQVQLTRPDGSSEWRDSRSARRVSVVRSSPRKLALSFEEVADGVGATVVIRGAPFSGTLRFRIEVANRSDLILEQVVFPVLRVKRPLGESAEDDRLFVPGGDGYVAGPEAMERQRWQRRTYPGQASMQFSAYYDSRGHGGPAQADRRGDRRRLRGSLRLVPAAFGPAA